MNTATANPASTTASILAPVASLMLPDSNALTGSAERALAFVDAFTIDSQEMYALAADELQGVKRRINTLEAQRTGITGPINTALRAINELFKRPTQVLEQCEAKLKTKMLGWQTEQERIAAESRRKADEAAAAARRRLEAEAAESQRVAAEQAAAAAAAAEAQRQAEATAAAAAAAGNAVEAARAQREAEAQAQAAALAQAATVRAQAEAQTAATTAQLVTAPVLFVEPPRAAGVSTSKKLDFLVLDLHALIKHVAAHPELTGLLTVDQVRLRAYVKGLGTACALPGVNVFESKVISSRAAG